MHENWHQTGGAFGILRGIDTHGNDQFFDQTASIA